MGQADTAAPAKTKWSWISLERLLCLGAAGVLIISLIYTPENPPALSVCTFNTVTGLPCPGCGLTRSFCAISHARLSDAWAFNPFGFFWYALTVFLLVRPLLAKRKGYLERERKVLASHWGYIGPLVLVGAMWTYGLYRMWTVARENSPAALTSSPAPIPSPQNPSASPTPAQDGGASPSKDNPV